MIRENKFFIVTYKIGLFLFLLPIVVILYLPFIVYGVFVMKDEKKKKEIEKPISLNLNEESN